MDGTERNPFGGWLDDMGQKLISSGIDSFIAVYPGKKKSNVSSDELVTYEFVETDDNVAYFQKILNDQKPNLIHIWGTEFIHSCQMFDAARNLNMESHTLVSIQGLLSVIKYHWYGGLPESITSKRSLIDFIVGRKSLQGQRKSLQIRFESEERVLKNCYHIIGRTRWDHACVKLINPTAKYYFCNESLRNGFYHEKWEYDKCEKYSILTGSWGNPIKGLHNIVYAVELLKEKYPDIKVYVCGRNPYKTEYIRLNSYERFVRKLIKEKKLESVFCFLGLQNENEMCNIFKRANVYVNSSAIENSSNTIGEAMIVGTPCVISDVGGAHDMVKDGLEGFIYPYDEFYMMAYYVDQIFSSRKLSESMSSSGRAHALERHDRDKNFIRLMEIYRDISVNTPNID